MLNLFPPNWWQHIKETWSCDWAGRGSAHARYLFVALVFLVPVWSSETYSSIKSKDRTVRQDYTYSFWIINKGALWKRHSLSTEIARQTQITGGVDWSTTWTSIHPFIGSWGFPVELASFSQETGRRITVSETYSKCRVTKERRTFHELQWVLFSCLKHTTFILQ